MVLVLLKCYGSVESSSEEEFAGFPEEDSTMSAKIPQFPIRMAASQPAQSCQRLSKKEKLKKAVAKKRRSGHRAVLAKSKEHYNEQQVLELEL